MNYLISVLCTLTAVYQTGAEPLRKNCVVFGVPEQAIRLGAVCQVVSLDRIADYIIEWGSRKEASERQSS